MGNKITYQSGSEKFDRYLERKKIQPKEDQYLEAGVLIGELKKVNTDYAYIALHNKIAGHTTFRVIWSRFSRIAAILIIPLLIFTVWKQIDEGKPDVPVEISYQEISNPPGIRSKVVLPDGSKIWLNAGSKIRYSIPFTRETREVELVGEAFLDVARNPDSPLEVKINQLTVRVLGTKFNVKAFPDDGRVEVVLKEGSIHLENNTESAKEQIHLKPNELWVYDKISQSAVLKKVDVDEHVAWHRNMLVLNKTTMAELAVLLERWYGVNVEISGRELHNYKFTTVFDDEPLHRVIELLEMSSPIRIKYIRGKFNRKSGETEKSTIQISAKR